MPSLTNTQPLTPSAPNDMTTADCYVRIDQFLNNNASIKNFKIDDDWIVEVTEIAVDCFC